MNLAELRSYRDQIASIAAEHGVVAVRAFGSVARGDAGENSDVDLLVELEPGRSLSISARFSATSRNSSVNLWMS